MKKLFADTREGALTGTLICCISMKYAVQGMQNACFLIAPLHSSLTYAIFAKNNRYMPNSERHPLQPFLPQNARILMLGSFPPPKARWSMEFFYPNWINDMWRIFGYIFYNDRHHFEVKGENRFCKEEIVKFCTDKGIALYDTACEVKRLKDNASDKFLEVVTPTDINALLAAIPHCTAVVTTGQKATDVIIGTFCCEEPPVGGSSRFIAGDREISLWRMPSSSRAYPLALDKKAGFYRTMLESEGIK